MTNHRVRIRYVPPTDLAFGAAVKDACAAASLAGFDIDTPDAARIAEEHLGCHGYPNAEIRLFRSIEEYRSRATNWVVHREGRIATDVGRPAPARNHLVRRVGPLPAGGSPIASLDRAPTMVRTCAAERRPATTREARRP